MAPCTSNVAINSLKAYLSHNHLLPSSMEHDSGNETSQHQVSQCWCQIIKWLIIDAFQRKISIKREKCKRKIKMGSVLLRELSKMEPGGHWGSVMYTHVSLDGIWPFDHPLSYSRYLSDPHPKTTHDSLQTNISWLLSESITILSRQL